MLVFSREGAGDAYCTKLIKNNAPEEPEVLKEEMLKQIHKLSTVCHWVQMVNTNGTWVKSWKPHKALPFTKPSLCLGGLASSGGCAHVSSWWKSGPVGSTSDQLVCLGAVGSLLEDQDFPPRSLSQPAAWQPGMVEKLLTDSVGCQSHGLIGSTISPAGWGETGNYPCQARGAVKTSGLVAALSTGYHQGHGHIHGIMRPQINVKIPGSDTGQTERWENQEKIFKKHKHEKYLRCFMVFHYCWHKSATRSIIKRFFCFV